ncbi:DM13 domain-containing protein [Mariniflexile gromovii]|uniref:DM13 domain-containing protein n=1 Tax=Mariniflexile gromovii TaxID=362523 RepID=A0ABS4BU30_9FLAO|nr:DM13 domain-containing protein [Mariniflexile gromovii]MBP0904096.1 DM13 domain-containing protein [Mariniflexile gromovii]
MKIVYILLLAAFSLQSCSSSDTPMMEDEMQMEEDDMMNTSAFEGDFVSSAHPTSGKASVNTEKTILSLTNFKTDSGPSLEIYLATNTSGSDYITLGAIKGVDGNYNYALPANVDLTKYNHVIVWCVPFSVNFGYAVLK